MCPRLFQFHARRPVRVQLVDERAEALEIRVYGSIEGQFHVWDREAANERIVVALEERPYVWSRRPAEIRQGIEAHIHVGTARARGSHRWRGGSGA